MKYLANREVSWHISSIVCWVSKKADSPWGTGLGDGSPGGGAGSGCNGLWPSTKMSGQKAVLPNVQAELHKGHVQHLYLLWKKKETLVGLGVKNLPANAGDIRNTGLIPGWGRSPWGRHGKPLQYSCLKNSWTEKFGRLQSIELQRVSHNWSNLAQKKRLEDTKYSHLFSLE